MTARLLSSVAVMHQCVRLRPKANAVLVVTDWPELAALDWSRVGGLVRRWLVVDGRNLLDEHVLADLDFTYLRIGRCPGKNVMWRRRSAAPVISPAVG
jgi:hypothetical protein